MNPKYRTFTFDELEIMTLFAALNDLSKNPTLDNENKIRVGGLKHTLKQVLKTMGYVCT